MHLLAGLAGAVVIVGILWDAFESVVLPRRVSRKIRLSRIFIRLSWTATTALVRTMRRGSRRDTYLAFYGPLSTIGLLAAWAVGLILGFAALLWALGPAATSPDGRAGFGTDLYLSGTAFFTLGLGDVVPRGGAARLVAVLEAGLGFAFLAMVISYLPVIYQGFSRRETRISMLDAWAGSPPSGGELIRRAAGDPVSLERFLREWEHWAAELLESHISYPVLIFFRSQHDNQSWLAALTAVLDACALAIAVAEHVPGRTASLVFAMARHAVVDLSIILNRPPLPPVPDRLPPAERDRLFTALRASGLTVRDDAGALARFGELRALYEPYVNGLSAFLLMPLPGWVGAEGARDNWQKSAWR